MLPRSKWTGAPDKENLPPLPRGRSTF